MGRALLTSYLADSLKIEGSELSVLLVLSLWSSLYLDNKSELDVFEVK